MLHSIFAGPTDECTKSPKTRSLPNRVDYDRSLMSEMEAFFKSIQDRGPRVVTQLLLNCQTIDELTVVVAARLDYYNRVRPALVSRVRDPLTKCDNAESYYASVTEARNMQRISDSPH